jgi:hypothetical protein
MKNIKSIAVLAAFAAYAAIIVIGNLITAARGEPEASVEFITSSILVPAVQELPAGRYLAQN